jgi:peptidoglycan L-alanyl-D-glutamate endopeptidase CwlK
VSDTQKSGGAEQFDEESEKLLKGLDFIGDCDTATNTVTQACKKTKCFTTDKIIHMCTPNHYIGGIIDKDDVWVFENTGYEYTIKALDDPDFATIVTMPTKDKYKYGYIKPVVYKLSELQKGITIPEKRGKAFMIPAKVKKYYMEQFMTLDEGMGDRWWTKRDDLPFLEDFKLNRNIEIPSAELINSDSTITKYWFTKEWEASFKLNVGFFAVDATYDSEKEQKLDVKISVLGTTVANIKNSEEEEEFEKVNNFRFGKRSRTELVGVHPELKLLATELLKRTSYDFGVFDGVRTQREQWKLVQKGVSKSRDSYHLYGLAIDLVPYINGKYTWEGTEAEKAFKNINDHALDIIAEYQLHDIENGFDKWGWDKPHWQMTGHKDSYDVRRGGFLA